MVAGSKILRVIGQFGFVGADISRLVVHGQNRGLLLDMLRHIDGTLIFGYIFIDRRVC